MRAVRNHDSNNVVVILGIVILINEVGQIEQTGPMFNRNEQ
jgi:hypothetical protein